MYVNNAVREAVGVAGKIISLTVFYIFQSSLVLIGPIEYDKLLKVKRKKKPFTGMVKPLRPSKPDQLLNTPLVRGTRKRLYEYTFFFFCFLHVYIMYVYKCMLKSSKRLRVN